MSALTAEARKGGREQGALVWNRPGRAVSSQPAAVGIADKRQDD